MGLKGQWWPLAHGGFCPRPSRARWKAVRTCNSSSKVGCREQAAWVAPGRVQNILSTGAPIWFEIWVKVHVGQAFSTLYIWGLCFTCFLPYWVFCLLYCELKYLFEKSHSFIEV